MTTPTYEPRRLPRIVTGLVLTAMALGTLLILMFLAGLTVLTWQQVTT